MTNQKGFTLIELLIVIVIIGILAGVLIALINPAQQQNRARDANVQATINKIALAAQGYISAYGAAPNGLDLLNSLSNSTAQSTTTCRSTDSSCVFSVSGNNLPSTCGPNFYNGTGSNLCHFRYERVVGTTTRFRIFAKSFGLANTVFRYDNEDATCASQMTACNVTGTSCTLIGTGTACAN